MNVKIIGAIIIILVLAAAAVHWHRASSERTANSAPQEDHSSGKIVPQWGFSRAGVSEITGAQITKVTLTIGDRTYDAGVYSGSCAEIGAEGGVDGTGLLEGEVSGVQCWFAGGGDEVGIFEEGGTLVIKHGALGEPQGDGSGAFRGNFTAILSL